MIVDDYIYEDKIIGTAYAPGYRNFGMKISLNRGDNKKPEEVEIRLSKEDSELILDELISMYGVSQSDLENPLPIDWDENKERVSKKMKTLYQLWKSH